MLEGKSEKLEFRKMSSSPHWKIEMSKNKTKVKKKRTKRKINNQRKMNEKRDEWKDNEKWFFRVMIKGILGLITLKHNLGLLILSFGAPNPGLHYIPKKSILIECGYLGWRVSSLRKFCNQQGYYLFSSAKILNKSLTCSGWIFFKVHNRTIEKWKRMKRKMWL